jgi:hypothetical protein
MLAIKTNMKGIFTVSKQLQIVYTQISSSTFINLSRIQNDWTVACQSNNVPLPKKAVTEFKKRLLRSANEDGKANKAKLNFAKCGLDDKMVRS